MAYCLYTLLANRKIMWGKTEEKRLEELKMTKKQIEELSDKTIVGVGIITQVLLEAKRMGLVK